MKFLGINLFGSRIHEVKQSQSQAVSMLMYVGQEVAWMKKNIGAYAREGYMACVDAYACIDLIAKAISGIPLVLEKPATAPDGESKRIESHPALDLMSRPNPRQGGSAFIDAAIRWLLIAGNNYIEAAGPTQGPPRELYVMKPNRCSVLIGSRLEPIKGYRYRAGGDKQDFPASQVLHTRFFNPDPDEDFYGLAPIEIAARAIDTSNLAQASNARLCKNDFRPNGVFMIEQQLDDGQRRRFNAELKESYMGENSFLPLVLSGGKDYKQMSLSPRDADFTGLDTLTTRKICRVFNVPPELIGDPNNKTYSNYQEARLALYMETAIPLAQWFLDELNNWLIPKFEGRQVASGELRPKPTLQFRWDLDKIPALQEKRVEMYGKLEGAWWVSMNERRRATGQGDWKDGEGNVIMLPMGLIPYGDNIESEPVPAPEPAGGANNQIPGNSDEEPPKTRKTFVGPPELKGFWRAPERKRTLWDNYEQRVKAKEKSLIRELEDYLKRQAREIIVRVEKSTSPASIPVNLLDKDAAVKSYINEFKRRYQWLYALAVLAGRHMTKGKLYKFDGEDKANDGWVSVEVRKHLEKLIADSDKVITDETLKEIQAVMKDSLGSNLTVQEIANALKDKLVNTMAPVRARRIARTETGMLENAGNLDGFKDNEFVNRKGWLCSFVPASRDAHIEADGQEVGIDDAFKVGPDLMDYPLDRSHNPGAGNVINCLCAIYPVVE